jgi:hypothetical protein
MGNRIKRKPVLERRIGFTILERFHGVDGSVFPESMNSPKPLPFGKFRLDDIIGLDHDRLRRSFLPGRPGRNSVRTVTSVEPSRLRLTRLRRAVPGRDQYSIALAPFINLQGQ